MEQQVTPPECHVVERLFNAQLEAINQRLATTEQNVQRLNGEVDGHVDKLWERLNVGFTELKQVIADHAQDDKESMHNVETAMLTRVPAWVLGVMTTGGTIIGGLAMYILTHK